MSATERRSRWAAGARDGRGAKRAKQDGYCWNCAKKGPIARDCWSKPIPNDNKGRDGKGRAGDKNRTKDVAWLACQDEYPSYSSAATPVADGKQAGSTRPVARVANGAQNLDDLMTQGIGAISLFEMQQEQQQQSREESCRECEGLFRLSQDHRFPSFSYGRGQSPSQSRNRIRNQRRNEGPDLSCRATTIKWRRESAACGGATRVGDIGSFLK